MLEKNRKALEALARARPDALDPTRLSGSARQQRDLVEIMSTQLEHGTRRRVVARRRVLVPAVGLAAAAAVAIGAVAVGVSQNRGTQNAANPDGHLMLLTMAQSVQNQATSGNYWQYQTQVQDLYLIEPLKTKDGTGNALPYVVAQTWQNDWSIGVKPGEQNLMVSQLNYKSGPFTTEDTQRWESAGSQMTVQADPGHGEGTLAVTIGGGQPLVDRGYYGSKVAAVGPNNVNYDYLRGLPSDQTQLEHILANLFPRTNTSTVSDQANWMFNQVAGLITLPVSSGVRAAAYRILANLPGITSLGSVTDPLGRTGVAVALPAINVDDFGKQQQQLIVDPATNTILAQQAVLVQPSEFAAQAGLKAGSVLYYTATTHIGWTNHQIPLPTTP